MPYRCSRTRQVDAIQMFMEETGTCHTDIHGRDWDMPYRCSWKRLGHLTQIDAHGRDCGVPYRCPWMRLGCATQMPMDETVMCHTDAHGRDWDVPHRCPWKRLGCATQMPMEETGMCHTDVHGRLTDMCGYAWSHPSLSRPPHLSEKMRLLSYN